MTTTDSGFQTATPTGTYLHDDETPSLTPSRLLASSDTLEGETMKTASTLAAVVLLAACADTDDLGPGTEPDPAAQTDEEPAEEPDEEPEEPEEPAEPVEDLEPDEDEEAEGHFIHELEDPVVYEDSGIRLSITGIGITSMDSPVIDDELHDYVEDGTETLLALEMTVSNDAGEEVNVYANQGTIQVGREQVDADIIFSDSFAGEMRDGVDDDGQVIWQLSAPFDDVMGEGALDYVASAPSSNETYESVAADIELTVEWDAP